MLTAEQRQAFDARLRVVEDELHALRGDMQMADAAETAVARSDISGARLAVGRARAEIQGGVRVTDESMERAIGYLKDSTPAKPTGLRTVRRGRRSRADKEKA